MFKKLFLVFSLLLGSFSYAQSYTLVFANVQNKENARHFIHKYLKNKKDVRTIRYKKRYRVIYGKFKTKQKAYSFKNTLSYELKKLNPFPVRLSTKKVKTYKKKIYKKKPKNKISKKIEPIVKTNTVKNSHNKIIRNKAKKRFIFPKKYLRNTHTQNNEIIFPKER